MGPRKVQNHVEEVILGEQSYHQTLAETVPAPCHLGRAVLAHHNNDY